MKLRENLVAQVGDTSDDGLQPTTTTCSGRGAGTLKNGLVPRLRFLQHETNESRARLPPAFCHQY